MESVADLYREIRERFPEATAKADAEHRRLRFDVDPEFAWLWFESLAKALNKEMATNASVRAYEPLMQFLGRACSQRNTEIGKCIDASFVENLFWEVHPENAKPYWNATPQNLRDLYIAFHGASP